MNTRTDPADAALDALDDDAGTHAFEPGDTVFVYNTKAATSEPIMEGKGEILACSETEDHYTIRFSDGTVVERFVYPGECQTDPDAYLKNAVQAWKDRNGIHKEHEVNQGEAPVQDESPTLTGDEIMQKASAFPDHEAKGAELAAAEGRERETEEVATKARKGKQRAAAKTAITEADAKAPATPAPKAKGKGKVHVNPDTGRAVTVQKATMIKVWDINGNEQEIEASAPSSELVKRVLFLSLKAAKAAKAARERKAEAKAPPEPKAAQKAEEAAKAVKERGGTKQEIATNLLLRPEGATIAQIADATRDAKHPEGWQPHSIRGFIATAKTKRGYTVENRKIDGVSTYFAKAPAS